MSFSSICKQFLIHLRTLETERKTANQLGQEALKVITSDFAGEEILKQ